MIIKKTVKLSLLLYLIFFGGCQSSKNATSLIVYDLYEKPLYHPSSSDELIYYLETGEKIIATDNGVEFCEGRDSLSNYLLIKYVNHPNYSWIDYNMRIFFVILFDKDLEIKEVRISNRYDKHRYPFEDIFIQELKNTEGMWCKLKPEKEWYYYFHVQKIY